MLFILFHSWILPLKGWCCCCFLGCLGVGFFFFGYCLFNEVLAKFRNCLWSLEFSFSPSQPRPRLPVGLSQGPCSWSSAVCPDASSPPPQAPAQLASLGTLSTQIPMLLPDALRSSVSLESISYLYFPALHNLNRYFFRKVQLISFKSRTFWISLQNECPYNMVFASACP